MTVVTKQYGECHAQPALSIQTTENYFWLAKFLKSQGMPSDNAALVVQVTRPDPSQLPALRETYGSAMHTGVHVRFFGDCGQCAIVPAKFVEEFDQSKQMRSANQRLARTSAVAEAHSVLHPQQRPRWR